MVTGLGTIRRVLGGPARPAGTLISGTAEVAFMVMCGCVCVFVCLCVTIANCYNRPRANAKETQC